MSAIQSFLNPFNVPDKGKLHCISSRAPAPAEVEKDMMAVESIEKQAKEKVYQGALKRNVSLSNQEVKIENIQVWC